MLNNALLNLVTHVNSVNAKLLATSVIRLKSLCFYCRQWKNIWNISYDILKIPIAQPPYALLAQIITHIFFALIQNISPDHYLTIVYRGWA